LHLVIYLDRDASFQSGGSASAGGLRIADTFLLTYGKTPYSSRGYKPPDRSLLLQDCVFT
jgi:hypothetical protein